VSSGTVRLTGSCVLPAIGTGLLVADVRPVLDFGRPQQRCYVGGSG